MCENDGKTEGPGGGLINAFAVYDTRAMGVFILCMLAGWMIYTLVKILWPGTRLLFHRVMVWIVVHHHEWTWASCYVRLLEPEGPDVACETVCPVWRDCMLRNPGD